MSDKFDSDPDADGHWGELVFVSYSHVDRSWLSRLLILLNPIVRAREFEVWADPYIEVGGEWRRSIERVINRSKVALLLVSADFLASRFILEVELPRLIERGIRLAPVLVHDCLWEFEPLLAERQWLHDPRQEGPLDQPGSQGGEQDRRLVDICRRLVALLPSASDELMSVQLDPAPVQRVVKSDKLGDLNRVPVLPEEYIDRSERSRLIAQVLSNKGGTTGVVGMRHFGVYGQGGIGKSVLACAAVRSDEIRSHFSAGIYWITLGEHADILAAQIDLLRRLDVNVPQVRTITQARKALIERLQDANALLVVDDIWSAAAAHAFTVTGQMGRVLFTSRDAGLFHRSSTKLQHLGPLGVQPARALAAAILAEDATALPPIADEVLNATGRGALAVALVSVERHF